MKLAKRIYGPNGETFLNAGVILTPRYIKRLERLGFSSIYVKDKLLNGLEVKDVIREETRIKAVKQVKNLMVRAGADGFKSTIICSPEIEKTVEEIVDQVLNNQFPMVNLIDIRSQDEYLFYHSVNVCILSILTGLTLGLGKDCLIDLAIGALLHDIGKTKVPLNILNKPGKLTDEEWEEVKKHTVYGCQMLKNNHTAAKIAYSHHERVNGEGYPCQKKGSEISLFAQITGIADVYDAVTADRCYRKARHSSEALEMLSGAGDYWFDIKIVEAFMENIAAYPTGTFVEISTGEIGIVVVTPKGHPFFPDVKVFLDAKGNKIEPLYISTLKEALWVNRMVDEKELHEIGLLPSPGSKFRK